MRSSNHERPEFEFSKCIHSFIGAENMTDVIQLGFNTASSSNGNRHYSITESILTTLLNTTRAGSAQKHTGMSFDALISSLVVSIVYCGLQTFLFTILRGKLKTLYQTRLFQPSELNETCLLQDSGPFGWMKSAWKTPLCEYKQNNGLDSFFFLRFMKAFGLFFLSLSLINIPVLVPIHYCSGTQVLGQTFRKGSPQTRNEAEAKPPSNFLKVEDSLKAQGLDKLSISNVSPQHADRLIFHFILAAFVVLWFHALLIRELRFCIAEKNKALSTNKVPGSIYQSVLFLDNIPKDLALNKEQIPTLFRISDPNDVQLTFLPTNHQRLKKCFQKERRLVEKMEHLQLKLAILQSSQCGVRENSHLNERTALEITPTFSDRHVVCQSNLGHRAGSVSEHCEPGRLITSYNTKIPKSIRKGKLTIHNCALWTSKLRLFFQTSKITIKHMSKQKIHIKIKSKWLRNLGAPGSFNIIGFRVDKNQAKESLMKALEKLAIELVQNRKIWRELSETPAQSVIKEGQKQEEHPKKLFITFKNSRIAHLFAQILISGNFKELNDVIIGPNPIDIIWNNIVQSSRWLKVIRVIFADLIAILVILGWVLPVAFVGLISQIPNMKILVPFFTWLDSENAFFSRVLSSLVPILFLIFLIDIVPFIFRWLSILKVKRTGAEIELDVQRWLFVFFFVHIFLVVTVSSGVSVIFEKLINNPTSLPDLLAANLPKSSNFFYSFILVRGLAYFGGNLLQVKELLLEIVYYRLCTRTPRKMRQRMEVVSENMWGSVYPLFSTIASICIVYSVIAPLVLIFSTITFMIVQFSFKCRLNYQQNSQGKSETFGRLYPQALMQSYAGIYCLEICMIGLFALSNRYGLIICMALVFVFTILAHFRISKLYGKLIKFLPLKEDEESIPTEQPKKDLFPFFVKETCLWVPQNPFGIPDDQCRLIYEKYDISCRNKGCFIDGITGGLVFLQQI
ncbi:LAQU0S05e00452g1_1 [Lachancea quebecensis]|uniref:LAQU0S05e00452g1_1 n=1 Tax=Lachancea quebecensis TaxID=1654605 RepID=A0A0N7MLG5_9SACH|nr:LAQU0S05e00452g1_1 [Lachancea quebecensis]